MEGPGEGEREGLARDGSCESDLASLSEREVRLNRAVAGYLAEREAGRAPETEDFLSRHPELREELTAFLQDLDFVESVQSQFDVPSLVPAVEPGNEGPVGAVAPATFGKFELIGRLSSTGMGHVFKAKERGVPRIVALKIPSTPAARPEDLLRFELEAKATAALDHPNIVPLYEVSQHEGTPYFTMKFVEGGNLAGHVEYFTTDPRGAASLIETVALAVQYAHERGILHRDLKPSNIFVDQDGRPFVGDFGLAKSLRGPSCGTQAGSLLGSPSYMAPEQASEGRAEVTTASDVYSLGAVLYELLTGQPPFRADTLFATLDKVIHCEPERPSRINPSVPRDLETICLKCLEKEPACRYSSAAELALDLRRWLERRPIAARPTGGVERALKWARRRPAVAALGLVIGLTFLAVPTMSLVYGSRLRSAAEREREHAAEAAAQGLLLERYLYTARMSMAYEAWRRNNLDRARELLDLTLPGAGKEDLRGFDWYHLWKLCHSDRVTLWGHAGPVIAVAFSPRGDLVATASHDGSVRLWKVEDGRELSRWLDLRSRLDCLAFSPDGEVLATGGADGVVRVVEVAGGREVAAFRGHAGSVLAAAFSVRGDVIASGGTDGTLRLWSLRDRSALVTKEAHEGAIAALAFSPDGRILASASHDHTVGIWELPSGQLLARPMEHGGAVLAVAFSPDGRHMATGSWDTSAKVWDTTRWRPVRVLGGATGPVRGVAFSPDSRTVATASADRVVRIYDGTSGEGIGALRGHGREVMSVCFSPDGRSIASASIDATARIWDPAAAAGGLASDVCRDRVVLVAFPEDGTLVTGSDDGEFRRWEVPPAGGPPRPISVTSTGGSRELARALSSDGRLAAVADSRNYIRVLRIGGGSAIEAAIEECIIDGCLGRIGDLAFSPDSSKLAAGDDGGRVLVWRRVREGSPTRWVLAASIGTREPGISDLALSPDGRLLAVATEREASVGVYDVDTGMQRARLEGHSDWVVCLAFSPDSTSLVTGSLDWTLRLWDLRPTATAIYVRAFMFRHGSAVASAAFSPTGKILAAGSDDGLVSLWDLRTGQLRTTLEGHCGEVEAIAFSRDGRTLSTVGGVQGKLGEVGIWRGASDEEVAARRVRH